MFENAQQEPSGGSTKVIGVVVLLAIVVLVGAYFLFFSGAPPAERPAAAAPANAPSAANTPAPDADYRRDLVISRSDLGRDQTQTMAMWTVQISNRSREITYRNIKYITNYYDGAGNQIQQGGGTLPGEMGPGAQRTFSGLNDGLYPLATVRYTFDWAGADGFKP